MELMEIIRKEIEYSGQSLSRLGPAAGVDKAALCRILQGGSCKAETADKLLAYFGYEVKKKKR